MRRLVALLIATFALLLGAQSASAASCNVYNDFNDNGKLDGTYSISCLKSALGSVQGDASTYTEIVPVIQAKIYAEKRADALAKQTASSGPDGRTNSGVAPLPSPSSTTKSGSKSGSGSGTKNGSATGSTTGSTPTKGGATTSGAQADPTTDLSDLSDIAAATPPATTDKGLHAAIDNLGPKKATDVPTPVIVLGVFAVLLIGVGSAGLVLRRRRGSAFDGSDDPTNLSL